MPSQYKFADEPVQVFHIPFSLREFADILLDVLAGHKVQHLEDIPNEGMEKRHGQFHCA
jgi:hypothetical protein